MRHTTVPTHPRINSAASHELNPNMQPPIQAVIFDADGTLIDSEVPGMDVLYEMACEEGLNLTREEAHQRFRGSYMADLVAWIAEQLPHKADAFGTDFIQRVRQRQAERFHEALEPMPGAPELLRRLKIPYCIATNGPREKIELTLKLSGLSEFFGDHVFSAYDKQLFKPDPGLFLVAASTLGVAPEHCAVVEDSLPGIQAGLNAGMQVYSLHGHEGLPAEIAERITFIADLHDLMTRWVDVIDAE